MEVVHGVSGLGPRHGRLFIVVGVFDGLHRGHLYLLGHLRREAALRRARPAVVTFDAHPDEVLTGSAPPLLCDPEERLVRLERAGVEVTIVQHFDVALRETPYDRFVEMIRERTEVAGFLMTPDAAFGHHRRGTPSALAELGRRLDPPFDVSVVPPLELDGRPVRSGEIRSDLAAGDLAAARRLLGRSLSVVGEVTPVTRAADGQRRAVHLGFGLPVALPPPAAYRVLVEPGWVESGHAGRVAARRATAVVDADDGVRIASARGLPIADRLRVTFLRRASPTAPEA
ncbi:MAG TPA: hypothetical protein VIV06_01775 [Candidatus Limnocylindrales bacterium]